MLDTFAQRCLTVYMRTTVDLPDELLRRVKARAAMDGVKLKALVAAYIEQGLAGRLPRPGAARERSPIPIARPATGVPLPLLSSEEIERILALEDADVGCGDRSS